MKLRSGACLVALASALAASTASAQLVEKPMSKRLTVADLVRKLPKPDGLRRKVINAESVSNGFIFAAAGSVQGAGGTFFRSDVTIVNHRDIAQDVGIAFMAQGVDNSNEPLHVFPFGANQPIVQDDLVGFLQKSGLGSLFVLAVNANGDPDTNGEIDGSSRIWTPQPGASGSVSQGFPSVSLLDSFGSATAYALALRHDTGFRTNAGIVNLDSVAHTWTVTVNGVHPPMSSFNITVPAFSMKQQVIPNGNYGNLLLAFETNDTGFWWSAYGAAVDSISGDSWSSHASQP
jgi:hypothetical protein